MLRAQTGRLPINQAGGNTSTFSYGPDRQVYRQVSVDGAVTEDRTTIGGMFEKNVRTGGPDAGTEYVHYIRASGKVVAVARRTASLSETYYPHEDHLGSTDVITRSGGAIELRTSFDAWGTRRGSNWTGAPSAADKDAIRRSTHKGYTGHEQLDSLNLVHMGGRVYDPVIARFMSADPIIQDPYHSQSFNRYSYVWNNPLNATDPTGFVKCTGSHIDKTTLYDCGSGVSWAQNDDVQQKGTQAGSTPATNSTPRQAGDSGSAERNPNGAPAQNPAQGQGDATIAFGEFVKATPEEIAANQKAGDDSLRLYNVYDQTYKSVRDAVRALGILRFVTERTRIELISGIFRLEPRKYVVGPVLSGANKCVDGRGCTAVGVSYLTSLRGGERVAFGHTHPDERGLSILPGRYADFIVGSKNYIYMNSDVGIALYNEISAYAIMPSGEISEWSYDRYREFRERHNRINEHYNANSFIEVYR